MNDPLDDNDDPKTLIDDYEVGYGKPPQDSQFKPGKSGNPRGRPKGRTSLIKEIFDELNEAIEVTENGEVKTYTKGKILAKKLFALGFKGDSKFTFQAAKIFIELEEREQNRRDKKVERSSNGAKFQSGVLIVPQPFTNTQEFVKAYENQRIPGLEYDENDKVEVPLATVIDE